MALRKDWVEACSIHCGRASYMMEFLQCWRVREFWGPEETVQGQLQHRSAKCMQAPRLLSHRQLAEDDCLIQRRLFPQVMLSQPHYAVVSAVSLVKRIRVRMCLLTSEWSLACLRPSKHMRLWHRSTIEESDFYFFYFMPTLRFTPVQGLVSRTVCSFQCFFSVSVYS